MKMSKLGEERDIGPDEDIEYLLVLAALLSDWNTPDDAEAYDGL
jgi:hypothetical protein